MRPVTRVVASALICAVPAAAWLLHIGVLFQGEYFFLVYALCGSVFLALSALFGASIPMQRRCARFHGMHSGWLLLGNMVVAGILTLLALAVLNATSICVGQNNGDGHNTLTDCMVQTALVAVYYTVLLLPLVSATAYLGGRAFERWMPRSKEQPVR